MSFGREFALGVEEELLLVDAETHALAHDAERVLGAVEGLKPDLYAALVESTSPVSETAEEAVQALSDARARARDAGATLLGAGIHPAGPFGEAPHVEDPRYAEVAAQLRGLARRTPTCALHVHVGMPDREAALNAYNGLREELPLLQALAANSPFWHGVDSGLATARAQLFRGYPRAEIPPAFASWDEYERYVEAILRAGDIADYTFLWWDLRLHPNLGTVEVRAMDAQSDLRTVLALVEHVHAAARRYAESPPAEPTPRQALMESSYRAARDGTAATLWRDGALRPVPELLPSGNGADRQRAAFGEGGMRAVLQLLADETATPL